jgi:formylglycine-generating enzyme required for sulfatase activity
MPSLSEATVRIDVLEAFVGAIRAERDPWRQGRLLAIVRKQRHYGPLRDLAAELFEKENGAPPEERRCYWPALELLTLPSPQPPATGVLWNELRSDVCLVRIPLGRSHPTLDDTSFPEGPAHKGGLEAQLWLGRFPVTNAEYGRFLEANPEVEPPRQRRDPSFNTLAQPVVGVTCVDAQAFAQWAGLRLPRESEWEYGGRAGLPDGSVVFDSAPWGDWYGEVWSGGHNYGDPGRYTVFFDHGWFRDNSRRQTHSVGLKRPNAWGIGDVHGNVREWCEADDETSWGCPLRGGSWDSPPWDCWTENRDELRRGYGRDREDIGFRVAYSEAR